MNLNDIVLKQVQPEEFMQTYFSWYCSAPNPGQVDLAVITSPIMFPDHHVLLTQFLGDYRADKLSVNDKVKWIRYYARKTRKSDMNRITQIARTDRKRKGCIELYFKEYPYARTDVKIRFAELNTRITCYDLFFPNDLADWFTWQKTPNLQKQRTCAIIAPNALPAATPQNI